MVRAIAMRSSRREKPDCSLCLSELIYSSLDLSLHPNDLRRPYSRDRHAIERIIRTHRCNDDLNAFESWCTGVWVPIWHEVKVLNRSLHGIGSSGMRHCIRDAAVTCRGQASIWIGICDTPRYR